MGNRSSTSVVCTTYLDKLPRDILLYIFNMLTYDDLCSIRISFPGYREILKKLNITRLIREYDIIPDQLVVYHIDIMGLPHGPYTCYELSKIGDVWHRSIISRYMIYHGIDDGYHYHYSHGGTRLTEKWFNMGELKLEIQTIAYMGNMRNFDSRCTRIYGRKDVKIIKESEGQCSYETEILYTEKKHPLRKMVSIKGL